MPSDRSAVDTTTSTPDVAPPFVPSAVSVERITVPLGGALAVSTRAANGSDRLCPAAM